MYRHHSTHPRVAASRAHEETLPLFAWAISRPDNHQPLTLPRAAHVVAPLRLWYRTPPGEVRPGEGGLVLGLRHLPALAEAWRWRSRPRGRMVAFPLDSPSEALGAL